MKILQFVLTSQAKYIQPELRKQRDKIEANVVEKWMINARRMPELASHLAISGAFQVQKRLLLWVRKKRPAKRVFFSGIPTSLDASSGSGLTQRSPTL